MELTLLGLVNNDFGRVQITKALFNGYGDIQVWYDDTDGILDRNTTHHITNTYLSESNFIWSFIAYFDTEDTDPNDDCVVFCVENQEDCYRLEGALLGGKFFTNNM